MRVGTRNSLAPSGEELSKTGVSTSVKPARSQLVWRRRDAECERRLTIVVQVTANYMCDFAPSSEIVGQLGSTEIERAVLGAKIFVRLTVSLESHQYNE